MFPECTDDRGMLALTGPGAVHDCDGDDDAAEDEELLALEDMPERLREARSQLAIVAAGGEKAKATGIDLADHNKKLRADAVKWAVTRPTATVCTISIGMVGIARLVHGMLLRSGAKWDTANEFKCLQNGHQSYRLLESASMKLEHCFGNAMLNVLCEASPWEVLSPVEKTMEARADSFAFLARLITGIHKHRVIPLKGCPSQLFMLLVSPNAAAAAAALLKLPDHELDCFTKEHFLRYPTAELLSSEQSLVELEFALAIARDDIAPMEAGHAHAQRDGKSKSLMRKSMGFHLNAATRICQEQRLSHSTHWSAASANCGADSQEAQSPRAQTAQKQQGSQRSKPSIGPWRLFCSEFLRGARKGLFGGEVFKSINIAYRLLFGTAEYGLLVERAEEHKQIQRRVREHGIEVRKQRERPLDLVALAAAEALRSTGACPEAHAPSSDSAERMQAWQLLAPVPTLAPQEPKQQLALALAELRSDARSHSRDRAATLRHESLTLATWADEQRSEPHFQQLVKSGLDHSSCVACPAGRPSI